MYNIIVFENKRFGNIRTFVEEGKQEPWFVAADVCRALEVKNAFWNYVIPDGSTTKPMQMALEH